MFTTVISAADLARCLSSPDVVIIDCRFDLTNPTAGEAAFREGHILGAIYAHLDRDLSGPRSVHTGRHPLPDPAMFAATLGVWGIRANTQVVAYDADIGVYAARLWWMLRWMGHSSVAVLEGGFKEWCAAGLPISKEITNPTRTMFSAQANRDAYVDANELGELMRTDQWRILDARAPERYSGDVEPLDPVAGHVPGAHNHPLASNLDTHGKLLPVEQLRARFESTQEGVSDARTVVMCGSGVSACHLLLAMEVAGKRGARLYPGSWSEWITDASRGVAKGMDP